VTILGIHSMELKVDSLAKTSIACSLAFMGIHSMELKDNKCVEDMKQKHRRNPFNGIERLRGSEEQPRDRSYRNPFNGIESS
jgi:hypothetical protein